MSLNFIKTTDLQPKVSGGKDKIHEHPNAGSNGFDKNPENINRNGRPRKSFASTNLLLREKGIEPIGKRELLDTYQLIFNATENELQELLDDPEIPLAFKWIIRELSNDSTRAKALKDLRDYTFGKANDQGEKRKVVIKVTRTGTTKTTNENRPD